MGINAAIHMETPDVFELAEQQDATENFERFLAWVLASELER